MLKVTAAIIDRANLGRMAPLLRLMQSDERIELSLLCGGSTTLKRFGGLADELAAEGYDVASRITNEIEGSTPLSMARSGGLCQMDAASELARLAPDVVVLIGDRYQALAVATAAVTLNVPVLHLQGGEVSGSLDERYRHALSKLCDYHVPATQLAAENLIRMGERPETIIAVGCPSADVVPRYYDNPMGFLMVVFHPDTNHSAKAAAQMAEVLRGVEDEADGRMIRCWWPNVDAGADLVAKEIRKYPSGTFQTVKNLSPEEYAGMLKAADCAIGNSSSFCRDSARFGTPVVLVGSRQDGRERGPNVLRVEPRWDEIADGIKRQLSHGRYDTSDLYGLPGVSARIVEALVNLEPVAEKRLAYV